jgi:hypothetical protein
VQKNAFDGGFQKQNGFRLKLSEYTFLVCVFLVVLGVGWFQR